MLRLLESPEIWRELGRLRGRQPVTAAIAYVNKDHLRLRAADTLICDASDGRVASGATTHQLLNALHERGVKLLHLDRLHAKVVRLQSHVAVGSANMTSNSSTLFEAAVVTDEVDALRDVDRMLARLLSQSKLQRIDRAFLNRIKEIPVKLSGQQRASVVDRPPVTWLMRYRELSEREETKSDKVVADLSGNHGAVPSYIRVPTAAATRFPRIHLDDKLMFVDSADQRVCRPVAVTGCYISQAHVYYCHARIRAGGPAWPRVQAVLKEAKVYSRRGAPSQLALDRETEDRLNRLFPQPKAKS